jgi:signal transduction histidine kinase
LPEPPDYAEWKAEQLALYAADLGASGDGRTADAPDQIWHLPDGRTLRVAQARHPLGGVLEVFDDITERLSLEARYNTQINVQRATLNNLSEGVAVFGADGALRLYNIAFQKLWRLDEEILGGRRRIDAVLGALKGGVLRGEAHLADIKRRATSLSPEDRTPIMAQLLSLVDGRTIQYGTEPLPDGATLVHFLDVTDSREREKELKERNAFLEDIDRQKSKFVDHISYQLRTPLATIIGFSEMLDNQMFGMLNDRQKDYIASILSASHHLRDLINDIIDLAVIDAGKMELEPSDIDIRDLLENAATYAALKAEDTQVALAVDCPKDIGVLRADAKRLKQVLFNLLSNAFAYTGAGGRVSLGADRAPGLVRIWIADTGRGVSPEDQAKAFDPFESRGPSAGAGIGLSLVQRFVSLHGGWVRMESALGKGTRVTCFLPAPAEAPAARPPQEPGAGDARPAPSGPPAPAKPRKRARRAAPKTTRQARAAE